MKIVSIDVGLNNLGLAFFKDSRLQSTHCIRPTPSWALEKKIGILHSKLNNLLGHFFSNIPPEEETLLLFENPYFSFNSPTGKKLDYVVGIIHLLAFEYGCTLDSYTASEVKKELGVKILKKKQTREENKGVVKELVRPHIEKDSDMWGYLDSMSDHEVDAIAVGLCYLSKENKLKELIHDH